MALGALAGALGSAAISAGASALFGSKKSKAAPATNFANAYFSPAEFKTALADMSNPGKNIATFNAGGLSTQFNNGTATVTSDTNRAGQVTGISDAFAAQAAKLGELAGQIAPGTSALRSAQLQDIENSRRAAIGDLRENLNRRRVLGSSFAQDALIRADKDYNEQSAKVIAETYMTELEATHTLANETFAATRQQFATLLNESNLQAGIAGELASQATEVMSAATRLKSQLMASIASQGIAGQASNADTNQKLAAEADVRAGSFWGDLAKPVGNAVGNAISTGNLFS